MWGNLDSSASFGGGFLDNSRQTQDPVDKKIRRAQTITPVAIAHLLSVTSIDDLTLWNIPVRIISVVGVVGQSEESTTKVSYEITDDTGTITALKWLEAEKKMNEPIIEKNTYVKVYGLLREQSDKRHILILRMQPLESLNELTSHLLEITYSTLKAESINKRDKENKGQGNGDSLSGTDNNSAHFGMTGDQTLVYDLIQAQNDTETGIERSELKERVPGRLLPMVDKILDFLVFEGHIYTTGSDDHFKST